MDKRETLEFIDRQTRLEEKIIGLVDANTSKLGNAFVKDLLLGIGQDSRKHAMLLQSLRAAVVGSEPLIGEEERARIAKGIAEHIKAEADAVKTYGQLCERSDDQRVKVIAAMIREDEVRHHRLLQDLHKTLIEPETLTDDAVWDALWADSPTHGTPGG